MSCSPILIYGVIPPPITPGDGGGGGIVQIGHGFIVGNVVGYNGTIWFLAKSDTAADAEAIGIVIQIVNPDRFVIATGGRVIGLSGLTPGTTYFLSDTVAGALSSTEPVIAGEISKPLLIADTVTGGYFFNWRGMILPTPTTTMNLNPLLIGTDFRISAITGGGKLEVRNPGTNLWAVADQWTNP